jgi:hypothetical protein
LEKVEIISVDIEVIVMISESERAAASPHGYTCRGISAGIACVTHAIAVLIKLRGIRNSRAVVAVVARAVFVAV